MCAYTKKRVYTHVGSYFAAGIKMHCPSLGENVSTVILLPLGLDGAYSLICTSMGLAAFYSIKMHLELVTVMYDNLTLHTELFKLNVIKKNNLKKNKCYND